MKLAPQSIKCNIYPVAYWADHFNKVNEHHINDPVFNRKLPEEEETQSHFAVLDCKIHGNEVIFSEKCYKETET